MQEQLAEERGRARETEGELKAEVEKLSMTARRRLQQQVINATINKGPANNTEAILQHEITRLTGENFDLGDIIKRLKRQLKAYMRKLNEAGVSDVKFDFDSEDMGKGVAASDAADAANAGTPSLNNNNVVICKKEHNYVGMFAYKSNQLQQVLKALIYDLKAETAAQMPPGLPACILFMMIRYTDCLNDEDAVRSLIQGAISLVKKFIKKRGSNDLEVKALWLSNMLRILHNLKQFSGERQFQVGSSPKQVEQCLRNFDLTDYRRVLSDIAMWIYQGVMKMMEEEIQPILVPAVLENEGMDQLIRVLTFFHSTLIKHGLDPEIISQLFRQLFYFICAVAVNNLLLRKDMCHRSRGVQIRHNTAQLEQWARDQKVHSEQINVIEALTQIVQASQLLQARKSEDDVQTICYMTSKLKVSQIIKILNLHTPADEFEERVTPAFVWKMMAKLQERAQQKMEEQATLLLNTKFSFAVRFPFNPSTIQLEELEIPEIYNGLHSMLKKL